MNPFPPTSAEILSEAEALLGPPVKIDARGWAQYWCPFHPDAAKQGRHRRPNFGVSLADGHWKCLRCGASGPSIAALARALGKVPAYRPPVRLPPPPPNPVPRLGPALEVARQAFRRSPAQAYCRKRGVVESTAELYGLGYGQEELAVDEPTRQAAGLAGLLRDDGSWKWADGVLYADPPQRPTFVQVRFLHAGETRFLSWGQRQAPLGAWRIGGETQLVIILEGLFDFLVMASFLALRGLEDQVVPVYTGGATPAAAVLEWLRKHPGSYLLIPDSDEAGEGWTRTLVAAIQEGEGRVAIAQPPDGKDPDEALLAGWWPPGV